MGAGRDRMNAGKWRVMELGNSPVRLGQRAEASEMAHTGWEKDAPHGGNSKVKGQESVTTLICLKN